MKRNNPKVTWLLFSLFGVVQLLAACAGEEAETPAEGDLLLPAGTQQTEVPGSNIPDNALLNHAAGDAIDVLFGQSGRVEVLYTDAHGTPIPGATIDFELQEGADLTLESMSAVTNDAGIASVTVFAGQTIGSKAVIAWGQNALPLATTVRTFPEDSAAYIVSSRYSGAARLNRVEVQLVPSVNRCSTLSPQSLPASLFTTAEEVIAGDIEDVWFTDLSNNTGYTVVAVGYMDPNVVAAFGCNDVATPIIEGGNEPVAVQLEEVVPALSGEFDIETRLNLVDALPEPWNQNVNFVGQVFANPARAIVDILFGDINVDDDGMLGGILGDGEGRRMIIEGVVSDLLRESFGDVLSTYFTPGGSVYRTLTQLTLSGTISVVDEPVATGQLVASNGHAYDSVSVYWTEGCRANDTECGRHDISLDSISGMGILSSDFTGHVVNGKDAHFLAIDRHSFDFDYGALAMALMERVVLPTVFGVDSIGQALGLMIDCQAIADAYFPNLFEIAENQIARYACDEALEALATETITRLSGSEEGIPGLSLATVDVGNGNHCELTEASYGPEDATRRFIGLGNDELRCGWDARLDASTSGQLIADFFAIR